MWADAGLRQRREMARKRLEACNVADYRALCEAKFAKKMGKFRGARKNGIILAAAINSEPAK